jgi:hypothetical protein
MVFTGFSIDALLARRVLPEHRRRGECVNVTGPECAVGNRPQELFNVVHWGAAVG